MGITYHRRQFLHHATLAVPSIIGMDALAAQMHAITNTGANQDKKLGIALLGLGKYAGEQLAPALAKTQHCKLAGIVTGTPDKIGKWKDKYNIPDKNVHNYDNFDSIKDNPEIDIVYICSRAQCVARAILDQGIQRRKTCDL